MILNLVLTAPAPEIKRCDSYFIFCLRALNAPPTQRGCDTPYVTSEVAGNNASIDFIQPAFLGTTNPFHLNASGLWQVSIFFTKATTADTHDTHLQGVQFYVEVKDRDYNNLFNDTARDDLIDSFAINLFDSADTHTVVMSPGTYRYGRISVTTNVQCAESYHGDQCQFVNKCERDSIECSGRGVCVAVRNSYICDCEPGYTGMNCEMTDYCFGQNCSVRGACLNKRLSYHRICDSGFTGKDCCPWRSGWLNSCSSACTGDSHYPATSGDCFACEKKKEQVLNVYVCLWQA